MRRCEWSDLPVHARWVYGQHPTEKTLTDYVRHWYAENTGWVDFYLFDFLL